jgi:hypothetical protein
MRRLVSVLAVACGIGLVVVCLSYSFFARASDGDHITDRFRTTMSAEGLVALDANFQTIKGLGDGFLEQAAPAFAKQLGMTPAQFEAFARANFPVVGEAFDAVPPAIALVDPVIPRLKASREDFEKVDDIPGLGLPIPAVPWMMVLVGGLLVMAGILGLAQPGTLPTLAVLLIALGMIVVPFALSLTSKAAAADRIVKVGDASLSRQAADTATATVDLLNRLVPEVQTKVVPALAARLHTTPAALGAAIARDYPGMAKGLQDWPKIAPSAAALAANQRASVDEAAAMDDLPFTALPWFVIAPGIALALLASAALLVGRENR